MQGWYKLGSPGDTVPAYYFIARQRHMHSTARKTPPPRKIIVVTLCALLTRDLLAIAKFFKSI